jgi:hypothetical protein
MGWIPRPAAVMGGQHRRARRTWSVGTFAAALVVCVLVVRSAVGSAVNSFGEFHCGPLEGGADLRGVDFVGVAPVAIGGFPFALSQHASDQHARALGEIRRRSRRSDTRSSSAETLFPCRPTPR